MTRTTHAAMLLSVFAVAACSRAKQETGGSVAIPIATVSGQPTTGQPAVSPTSPPVEGPRPPAKQPIDPKKEVTSALLLGSNASELWLMLDEYSVVVDRTTGCAVEGYPENAIITHLKDDLLRPGFKAAQLGRADVLAAIRDVVGLGRRFGVRSRSFVPGLTWTADGRQIYVRTEDDLNRSVDGGRSFVRTIEHVRGASVTADGSHLVYARCANGDCNDGLEYVSAATDGSRGPLPLARATEGALLLLELTPSGKAIFSRSEGELCLDTFDIASAKRERSVCVRPSNKATGTARSRSWQAVSPAATYGLVSWDEGRPIRPGGPIGAVSVLSLVHLESRQIVRELTDVSGSVDDDGNMVLSSMGEGAGDHTYFYPRTGTRKLLGHHALLEWDDKTAILGAYRVGTLGSRKCDLVKLVKTP